MDQLQTTNRFNCKPCVNFKRSVRYDIPLPPSPNLPNPTAVLLYPTLLFEGTRLQCWQRHLKAISGHWTSGYEWRLFFYPNLGAKDPFQNGKNVLVMTIQDLHWKVYLP